MRWALLMLCAGCAFDAGEPWGRLEVEVSAAVVVPEGRLDENGDVKTARDFRVRVDAVTVSVEAAEVRFAGGDGEAGVQDFDPANPPPGYSNCHNGHCHHESGALVDYEDIVAGAGGSAAGLHVDGEAVVLGLGEAAVVASAGEDTGLVSLAEVVVTVREVVITGHVTDARTGEAARLPEGGLPFSVVAGPLTLRDGLSGAIERDGASALRLVVELSLSVGLLDVLTFGDGGDQALVVGDLAQALAEMELKVL